MADDMPPPPKPPPGWYPHPQSPTGQRYWTGEHWGPPPLPPRPTGPPMPPRRGGLSTTAWIWTGLGSAVALLAVVSIIIATTGGSEYEDTCRRSVESLGYNEDNETNQERYDATLDFCIKACEEGIDDCG